MLRLSMKTTRGAASCALTLAALTACSGSGAPADATSDHSAIDVVEDASIDADASAADASTDADAGSPTGCGAPLVSCRGACIDVSADSLNCGACARACLGDGGSARCVAGRCASDEWRCDERSHRVGDRCVDNEGVRPVHPQSLSDVSLLRPTLRVRLPSGADGAAIDLCNDRACTSVIETVRASGDRARPSAALPRRSVIFWRARARVGSDESPRISPTWLFHTPQTDNSSGVDTSQHAHFDINGDGLDDIAAAAPAATTSAGARVGRVSVLVSPARAITDATELEGTAPDEHFGASVANAGDVDGDGFADLLIGAPGTSVDGRVNAGRATLVFGSSSGLSARRITWSGAAQNARFGASVSAAGDLDADGFGEVVVGEPGADARPSVRAAGAVTVYDGRAIAADATPRPLRFEGTLEGESLGVAVSSAGDVNGDGHADIVVGASGAGNGRALVLSLRSGALVTVATLEGPSSASAFGASVSGGDDTNNDGYSELVIGAPNAEPTSATRSGRAWVVFGSRAGPSLSVAQALSTGADSVANSFGLSVAAVHDHNGDGFDDVIVGAPYLAAQFYDRAGRAFVYFGSATQLTMGATPVSTLGLHQFNAGWDVSSPGDINGDGLADFLVGVPGAFERGEVRVVLAQPGAAPSGFAIAGRASGDRFGASVAR